MDRRTFIVGTAAVVAVAAVPAMAVAKTEHLIIPSLRWIGEQEVSVRDNTRTIRYRWMERWTHIGSDLVSIECAEVGSERYAQWLRDGYKDFGYLPHIQFGGCVVPDPKGDPEFYPRWLAYAKTLR